MTAIFPVDRTGVRLRLRQWWSGEAEAVHRWLGDPEVGRYLSWATTSVEGSAAHLDEILASQLATPRMEFFLAVERIAEPKVSIGDAGFTWLDDGVAEIGYFLEPAHWGHGYGVEAAAMIVDLIRDLGGRSVIATADERNVRSIAVMRALGLVPQASPAPGRVQFGLDL